MATTVKIEIKLFNKVSEIAKDENTTEKELINDIIKKEVKNRAKKIPDHLIMNKKTYNPNPEKSRELIGIIETKEPFNVSKAIRDIRGIE